ncbi:MAG: LysR family transcriptional regulator [Burkholderiaceae bacterium]|nr:LysR family transcriptional regulator [Burkholderiaceae bacterium]
MLTFKQIEALYWAVKLGTFSAAAEKLHTSQSAITKRIQELETSFSVTLFDRSGHRAVLTSKGHEVFTLAEKMLSHRDQLLNRLESHHGLTGLFRFGITEITAMTWLPSLIRQLRTRYPHLELEPQIDMAVNLHRQLQNGQIDMVFSNQAVPSSDLSAIRLGSIDLPWMGSPEHIDLTKVYTVAQIADMPLIRQSRDSGLNRVYDDWLAPYVPQSNLFTINSLLAMAGMAAAGFGICCLPHEYFSYMIRNGQLGILRTDTPASISPYYALFRREADSSLYQSIAELAANCCDFSNPAQSVRRSQLI